MIGTTYKPYRGAVDDFSLQRQDIQEVIDDINKIYPAARLTMGDVTFCHGGLLPMTEADESRADSVQLDKSSQIIADRSVDGANGFFSIKGVKYTTAPDIADKMVRLLQDEKHLGLRTPGTYIASSRQHLDHGPMIKQLGHEYEQIKAHLKRHYGAMWRAVFAVLVQSGGTKNGESYWLSEEPPLLVAEVLYFVHEEMASTLADVVFRRSSLGSAECPDTSILGLLANFMGRELSWTDEEQQRQIDMVLQVFAPLCEKGGI